MSAVQNSKNDKPEKEAIHSGQFMVSHFEAEEQDDEDDLAVPIPEVVEIKETFEVLPVRPAVAGKTVSHKLQTNQQPLAIDTSLSKLFQCMSIAYRQKLTSPKWNRFRGIRLRWKDKIRLNNVIWRCWHMQFIKKENTYICQFASPLDVDTHNKPEAVVLEGKYWKRKLAAVTAEYKKWRMFFRNQTLGHLKDTTEITNDINLFTWNSESSENMHMMVDEDYMGLMSDTLFSTITNQPFAFPDSREIAKAGLADFIQPSLGPLQPNLDDYMDTFEPLQEFMSGKLPTVPEEHSHESIYKTVEWCYPDFDLMTATNTNIQVNNMSQYQPVQESLEEKIQIPTGYGSEMVLPNYEQVNKNQSYQTVVISKLPKEIKSSKMSDSLYSSKSVENVYQSFNHSGSISAESALIEENFKIPHVQASSSSQTAQGYKFQNPVAPNLKFSQKDDKVNSRVRNTHKPKQRSRSNPRESSKRPPLITAVSDPAIVTPANSVLLTQLLTNHTDSALFNRSIPLSQEHKQANITVKEETTIQMPLINQANNTTTLIIPVAMNSIQNSADPLILNTTTLDTVSQNINSPTSSQGSLGSPNRENPRDQRRVGHIHAEQKRRYNIKNGFDMLHSLIPHLNQTPNTKLSKAAMLQKGAEYIRQLRSERNQLNEEMESLKQEIERLNTSISNCQSLLPATGAPVSRRRDSKIQEMFDEYVRTRTDENWKFWMFSLLFRPLLVSFNNFVSTQSLDDLYRSTLHWIEQHCTLGDLRPVVSNSLRYLCTQTDVLSKPEKLPGEARQAALLNKHNQNKSN